MRRYEVYLIEDEFALHYFHKEHLMYQLFLEYKTPRQVNDTNIKNQIDYITKRIPIMSLKLLIERSLGQVKGFRSNSIEHEYIYMTEHSKARLRLAEDYMLIDSEGTIEAETTFFEVLRKFSPCFLAMNYNENVYGWLNPIKEQKICVK